MAEERRASMGGVAHALEGVRVGLAALASAIEDLATKEDVALSERAARRRSWVVTTLVLIAFALLAFPIHQNRETINATRDTNRRVLECTTDRPGSQAADRSAIATGTTVPNYACRERGRRTTEEAVGRIGIAFLDALVCAEEESGPAEVESCFVERSRERQKAR